MQSFRLNHIGSSKSIASFGGDTAIIAVHRGSLLVSSSSTPVLVPEHHTVVLMRPSDVEILTSEGHNEASLWALAPKTSEEVCPGTDLEGVRPQRFVSQGVIPTESVEHCLGRALIVLGSLLLCEPRIDLAQHEFVDDPGTREVVEQIRCRQRPSLREAAEFAGYSHFHFSRRFRDLTGYGFHEYLDRVRTARALEGLSNAKSLVRLAEESGFSNVKTLRESVKDYTGFAISQIALPKRRELSA